MNKVLLHRFFEGNATLEEEKQLKQWIELSEANYNTFFHERKLYDMLLLTPQTIKQKRRTSLLPWKISTAAAVALLLIASGLYLLNLKDSPEEYNTVLVPPGQRINLILSDKSSVWLNANTEFRYPTKFSKKNRTVHLNGEAYFDVSKNEKKTFVVKTTHGDVHVTGTIFNVDAYADYNSFETSLFEGGVEIYKNETRLASLKPNEKITITNEEIVVSKIQDSDEYLWRNGLIAFSNEQLGAILLSLEKYFDVKIQISAARLPQHTYTGKFRQSDGVDYALRVLQRSIRFTYERNEETGIIYIK